MSKLFPNYEIDLKKGTVTNSLGNVIGSLSGKYYTCKITDIFYNEYNNIHQVIFAEGSGIPKHLWPIDEKGRRYEVDHILPVKNGGTDTFSNLRLLSKKDNHNNPITLENYSKAVSGEKNPMYGKKQSEELIEKRISKIRGDKHWLYGKHQSDEVKMKISEAKKGKCVGENNPMYGRKREDNVERFSIPVVQLTLEWEFIAEYKSAKEAEEKRGFNAINIRQVCRGEKKTHKGFKWMKKDEYIKMLGESSS